jgi:serine protease
MDPTRDSYEYFQGTSMASPHVAGVAALLVSAGIKDPAKIEEILKKTATSKGDATKYGAGILNAAAAVKAVKSSGVQAAETFADKPPSTPKEALLYFLAGVGFSLFYFKLLKRSDGYGKMFSFLFSLAMFLSSCGLFFVEFLPLSFVPRSLIHFVSSPIPNLDRVLFGYSYGAINPLLHSVLLPLVLIVFFLSTKHGKAIALGIAIGMAAHLFVDAFFTLANVTYIPGTFLLDKAWLIVNALLCFGLAVLAGGKR